MTIAWAADSLLNRVVAGRLAGRLAGWGSDGVAPSVAPLRSRPTIAEQIASTPVPSQVHTGPHERPLSRCANPADFIASPSRFAEMLAGNDIRRGAFSPAHPVSLR